jgi:hypothetical protein
MALPHAVCHACRGRPQPACLGYDPGAARCTTLAFSVNDYGKDGPTKTPRTCSTKYIAKWTKDNNVTNYTVGKKDVSCELFLNFIVFDEHTSRRVRMVCWPGEGGPAPAASPAASPPPKAAAKKAAG